MNTEANDFSIEWQEESVLFRLTRPEKRNALTLSIIEALEGVCDELDAGRGRLLILTGEGDRAFCSGTDLTESASLGLEGSRAKTERARNLMLRLHRASWTSIAALNGLAYGGGFELALACTFRVAHPGTRLSMPEVKLAVLPSYGGTQLLPATVGRARALDLMLTGRAVESDEALQIGLIDRLASAPETLLDEANALGASILAHSQFAIDRIRRCVEVSGPQVTDEGMQLESRCVEETMSSEDAREGVVAFFEKRPPRFTHR